MVLYELEVAAMADVILQGWGFIADSTTTSLRYCHVIIIITVIAAQIIAKCDFGVFRSVSLPDKVIFPPPNWTVRQSLREEQDIGPELQQVYEVSCDFLQSLHDLRFYVLVNIWLLSQV